MTKKEGKANARPKAPAVAKPSANRELRALKARKKRAASADSKAKSVKSDLKKLMTHAKKNRPKVTAETKAKIKRTPLKVDTKSKGSPPLKMKPGETKAEYNKRMSRLRENVLRKHLKNITSGKPHRTQGRR